MSPPPSKDQKDPNKNPPTEEIPSLEDIIGQMPKPDVDEITKLQVITKPILISVSPYCILGWSNIRCQLNTWCCQNQTQLLMNN